MRAHLTALLTITLAAISLPSRAQIALSFDWPDGLEAAVTHDKSTSRSSTKLQTSQGATAHYDLKVSRHSGDTLVTPTFRGIDTARLPAGITDAERRQVELMMQALTPVYRVHADGRFHRIEQAGRLRSTIQDLFMQYMPDSPQLPQARRNMDRMLSDEVLNSLAEGEWDRLVGFWLGAKLELFETYRVSYKGRLAMVPGRDITMNATFSVLGVVPCERGGESRSCVELEVRTVPQADEVAGAIAAMIDSLKLSQSAEPAERIESVEMEDVFVLVTEPQGLIPHRLRGRKEVKMVVRDAAGPNTWTQVEEDSSDYRYPVAAR